MRCQGLSHYLSRCLFESAVRHMGIISGRPGDERGKCKSKAQLCLGNIVAGVFTPVLAKHSKSFNLIDIPLP